MDESRSLTYLNIMHSVVTFYLFHWKKGSPVQADQGDYDSLTWWEQMDGEVQNTSNRKFFTSVPAALFLLAAHVNQYRSNVVYVNFAAVRAQSQTLAPLVTLVTHTNTLVCFCVDSSSSRGDRKWLT